AVRILRVAAGLDREIFTEDLGIRAEEPLDIFEYPDIERPLALLVAVEAVGVLGRREAALGPAEVAQHVVAGLARDAGERRLARYLPALQIARDELRLVVEHLLEVRHVPEAVDRVAM